MRTLVVAGLLAAAAAQAAQARAQDPKDIVGDHVIAHAAEYGELATQIWSLAEVGYQERESSLLLQRRLAGAGFEITTGVAGMPTAFVASWGSGAPVIGILAEFDALPGFSQDAVPERSPIPGRSAGHACGHHLFAAGSTAAALAVKDWLRTSGRPGTIRLYGTPAEEGGGAKVYFSRAGLFGDVDAVLHWHAGSENDASPSSSTANISAKFRFRGVSAHAAGAPDRGRSALDGVEAMNHMVNLMREHVPQETRIHYVITSGGAAPNVVPDFAEVYHYVRHPDADVVRALFERMVNTARGAALGTDTEMEYEIVNGVYGLLPNVALAEAMHANLERVGGVEYTVEEQRFAEVLRRSLPADVPPISSAAEVMSFDPNAPTGSASTDVGDVSWNVPTAGLNTATWVPGTSAHSWQAVAAGGTSIGAKGMIVAGRTLAMTAVDLFLRPDLVTRARAEFEERLAGAAPYRALVGDRDPPLDYRAAPGG